MNSAIFKKKLCIFFFSFSLLWSARVTTLTPPLIDHNSKKKGKKKIMRIKKLLKHLVILKDYNNY